MATRVSAPHGLLLSCGCRRAGCWGDTRLGPARAQTQSLLPTMPRPWCPWHLDGRTGVGSWGLEGACQGKKSAQGPWSPGWGEATASADQT